MNPFAIAGALGGVGNLFNGIYGMFNKGQNPANAANKELNKIPGQIKPYYDPYINAGKENLNDLQTRYRNNLDNPSEKYNKLGEGYTQSPGYQATLREALAGANNAAALGGAGGLGSYGHEQLASGAAGDVASKDFENYLSHIFDIYGTGLSGEQHLEDQGYDASGRMADALGAIGGQRAANAYSGADYANKNRQQDWSNIFKGAGQIGSSYYMGPLIEQMMKQYMRGGM